MNIYQRIILILAAIALIIAIWTSPRLITERAAAFGSVYKIVSYRHPKSKNGMIEPRTASMRAVAVVGATILIFFALKSKDKKE